MQLERVSSSEFLGVHVLPAERRVKLMLPKDEHNSRPTLSAGTVAQKLSPIQSRMSLASKYTYPVEQAHRDLDQLKTIYIDRGFGANTVSKLHRKFLASRT